MFTLRIVSDKEQLNWNIGDFYTYIDRLHNEEEFNKVFAGHYESEDGKKGNPKDEPNVTGFVRKANGDIIAIWSTNSTYVMTEAGATFAKLS